MRLLLEIAEAIPPVITLVPCRTCHVPRPIVGDEHAVNQAAARECRGCAPRRNGYREGVVACAWCGNERHVAGVPSKFEHAEETPCSTACREAAVDDIAVERLVAGDPAPSTRAERQAAVTILTRKGLSAKTIATRLRTSQRTVERLRARAAA